MFGEQRKKLGESYQKLNNCLVIFICTFDPFGKGYCHYSFSNRWEQDPDVTLGDNTRKIFLNTKGFFGNVSKELQDFLRYVEKSTDAAAEQSSPFVKELHQRVLEVKENKEMEVQYMTQLMREREKYEEGREEGREEGEVISNIKKVRIKVMKDQTSDIIAESLELDEYSVNRLIHILLENPTLSDQELAELYVKQRAGSLY